MLKDIVQTVWIAFFLVLVAVLIVGIIGAFGAVSWWIIVKAIKSIYVTLHPGIILWLIG